MLEDTLQQIHAIVPTEPEEQEAFIKNLEF